MLRNLLLSSLLLLTLISCGVSHPDVPSNCTTSKALPSIYPDYTEVTIPCNICPLNFGVAGEDVEEVVARFTAGDLQYTYGEGHKVMIDDSEWQELITAAKGKAITVEVFANHSGNWTAYAPFHINVANDTIDSYISYRLIQPSYVAYEDLSIAQRDLTSFDETDIYNNMLVSTEQNGQCINCHSYKNYRTDNMLFHMRQGLGGTMIVADGKLSKVNLKTDKTISAGVYPAWHPTKQLIAFSTNNTMQSFHTVHTNKIEVFDTQSDLILYDVNANKVSIIANDSTEFEVFPTWSPDGKTLYYCSAHFEYRDTTKLEVQIMERYRDVKYSIYSMSFNPDTQTFGERKIVYDAAADSLSATLPRLSPDGRYLTFALGEWGCFHVWHADADIRVIDLTTGEMKTLDIFNSKQSESYPSFSSTGRWLMTDSRRDDGNYTRPYIGYFDNKGNIHKPFELPQHDPDFYFIQNKSYNRPEFMIEPVKITPQEFAAKAKTDAIQAE